MNTKTCTKCGTTKPLNDYHNNKRAKDGKQVHCKKCIRVAANAWAKANRERSRANARAYRLANIEQARANVRKWNKTNLDRRKSVEQRRRARKAHAVPQRWKRTTCPDHLCYWCGITLTPEITHIDHIMPISLGGQDTPDNTANTCAKCNRTKNNTHPLVWLARITTPDPVC